MPFYLRMPASLRPYYETELAACRRAIKANQLPAAWHHLERAHILGQSYPVQHSYVHWKMFQFGIRIKSGKEIVGQIPRLLLGGVMSFVGKVPAGNTGGANIPPMRRMPIEAGLLELFAKAGVEPPR